VDEARWLGIAQLGGNAGLVGAASLILWEGEAGASIAMAQNDEQGRGTSHRAVSGEAIHG
jgi:glucokinase